MSSALYTHVGAHGAVADAGRSALRENLRSAHEQAWQLLGAPGASFTGAQRLALLAAVRTAPDCALCRKRQRALSPFAVDGQHDAASLPAGLGAAHLDAVHRIRTDPGRLTHQWFERQIQPHMPHAAYVELVSLVATCVIVDTLHASLGFALPALPEAQTGAPTGKLNPDAVDAGAWVPILDAPDGMADHGLPQVPNIARALGLVPSSLNLFFRAFRPHYQLQDLPLAISQGQAEFVASRVSALNECFY